LLDRGQLDQIVGEFLAKHPNAEPHELSDYLVSQQILTAFQAERILQGKTQGFVLGPYTLADALGTGSMGTVYKAQSKNDSKWYAVKVLPRRSMWNVRIARRKVRAFEHCQHPAVVPFVDVGTSGGMHYLAWPLVEGETLNKIVEREGPLLPARACMYMVQTAEGLDVVHQQQLFHGLLKPSNLMLGSDGQLRILDFGIGSLLAETEGESLVDTMSTANSVNNGLDCASPESIMDPTNLTPIGDQYSMGCVLYYLLSGRYPFPDGTAVEKMMAHQTKEPTPIRELRPELPDGLVALIERLMQKVPEKRYRNTPEVIEALKEFAEAGAAGPRRVTQALRSLRHPESGKPTEKRMGERKPLLPAASSTGEHPGTAAVTPSQQLDESKADPASPPSSRGGPPRSGRPGGPAVKPWSTGAKSAPQPQEPEDEEEFAGPPPRSMGWLKPLLILLAALGTGVLAWFLSSFMKM
jgi:serine/threonine-protein kinase